MKIIHTIAAGSTTGQQIDISELQQDLNMKKTLRSIAPKFGTTTATLKSLILKYNLSQPSLGVDWENIRPDIIQLRSEGLSNAEILRTLQLPVNASAFGYAIKNIIHVPTSSAQARYESTKRTSQSHYGVDFFQQLRTTKPKAKNTQNPIDAFPKINFCKNDLTSPYYVYIFIRSDPNEPLFGQPFYVGRGTGDRIMHHVVQARTGRSSRAGNNEHHKQHILRKYIKQNIEILFEIYPCPTVEDCITLEDSLIAKYGCEQAGGILTNIVQENGTITPKIKVDQFSKDGTFIKTHTSLAAAAFEMGNKRAGPICSCCKNKPYSKTAYGFIWKYHQST